MNIQLILFASCNNFEVSIQAHWIYHAAVCFPSYFWWFGLSCQHWRIMLKSRFQSRMQYFADNTTFPEIFYKLYKYSGLKITYI